MELSIASLTGKVIVNLMTDRRKRAQDTRKECELKFYLKDLSTFLYGRVDVIRLAPSSLNDGSNHLAAPDPYARYRGGVAPKSCASVRTARFIPEAPYFGGLTGA